MGTVFSALWQGIVDGIATKPGAAPAKPTFTGLFASVADALYALGYTVASIAVHGRAAA